MTNEELYRQYLSGNAEAFEQLYLQMQGFIASVAKDAAQSFGCSDKETLDELLSVLDRCTETQRRRFLLYALDGMSYAEIADLYGCSKASIFESIEAVRKKVKKYWMRCPDE